VQSRRHSPLWLAWRLVLAAAQWRCREKEERTPARCRWGSNVSECRRVNISPRFSAISGLSTSLWNPALDSMTPLAEQSPPRPIYLLTKVPMRAYRHLLLLTLFVALWGSLLAQPTNSFSTPPSTPSRSRSNSAQNRSRSSGGSVHVRSYTRKDGTRVRSHDRSAPSSKKHSSKATVRSSTPTAGLRSSNGRKKRSGFAKAQFMRESGYPRARPGYVVDHKKALACGGSDTPDNMQWQTVADAKAKDKTERIGCK
jgi:hypothetical protein